MGERKWVAAPTGSRLCLPLCCSVPGSSLIIEPHHTSNPLGVASRASLSGGHTAKSPQSKVKATKMDVEDGKLLLYL